MSFEDPASAPGQNQAPRAGFTFGQIVAVGVTLVVAVCVILGFRAVKHARESSENKSVMGRMSQLRAAADQYYLENNVRSVAIADLVGPTNYVKQLTTVAGETYPSRFVQGQTITVTGIGGARTITYAP